jgi:hypothetical protein
VAISAALLPTGKVLYFDDTGKSQSANLPANSAEARLFDPEHPDSPPKVVNPPNIDGRPVNIWCSGMSMLPDGRVLATGGNLAYSSADAGYLGLTTVLTFDPFTEKWQRYPDMRHGRWYPGQVTLPDGRSVIMAGNNESNGSPNPDVELFDPVTGKVSLIAERSYTPDSAHPPMTEGRYPHLFVMPSGRTLVAGPKSGDSWLFRVNPLEKLTWEDVIDPKYHTYGSGVLMPGGPSGSSRVMLIGGGSSGDVNNTAETFDETRMGEGWTPAGGLKIARGHHNTVLLPDGSMVSVGGGFGIRDVGGQYAAAEEHKQIELYDPVTGQWKLGPAQQELRAYHSTAVLLPDGRVMSAGDDRVDHKHSDTVEFYEPPYLHKGGERPVISGVQSAVDYAAGFSVTTPSTNVARAVLIAPGSTTHASDNSQRSVELQVTERSDGRIGLQAPPNANVAPPGYYMLFLVRADGYPSVARFVHVGGSSPPTAANPVPSAPVAPAPGTARTPVASRRTPRQASLRVRCRRACVVRVRLTLDARAARSLGLPRYVGRASRRFGRAGSAVLRVRLSAGLQRAIARRGAVRVTARVVVTESRRAPFTQVRRLALRR